MTDDIAEIVSGGADNGSYVTTVGNGTDGNFNASNGGDPFVSNGIASNGVVSNNSAPSGDGNNNYRYCYCRYYRYNYNY